MGLPEHIEDNSGGKLWEKPGQASNTITVTFKLHNGGTLLVFFGFFC